MVEGQVPASGISTLVLDANILIAYLDADDASHAAAVGILTGHRVATFMVSALNLAEVMVYPARAGALDAAQEALSFLDLVVASVDESSVVALASLRSTTGLKTPDVCALCTARDASSPLATLDRRLASVARSIGVEVVTP